MSYYAKVPPHIKTEYLLDYSINFAHDAWIKNSDPVQNFGANIDIFPQEGRDQILADFQQCIKNESTVEQAVTKTNKIRKIRLALMCLAFLSFIGAIAVGMIGATIPGKSKQIIIGGLIGFIAISCVGQIMMDKLYNTVGEKDNILRQVVEKMWSWKSMYPTFTFTIFYPVKLNSVDRGRRDDWCRVRVTQGTCQRCMICNIYYIFNVIIHPLYSI